MADVRTIFDEPHHQSLELLAAQALAENNNAVAFKLADRRCRILPLPEPHCYVLRGEARYRLGDKAAAIADVAKALEIDPEDVAANRRMLTWADGTQQSQAARAIIRYESNFDALRKAVQTLHKNGQRFFARVIVLDDTIEGWAVWQSKAPLEVSITDGAEEITAKFAADALHPLGAYGPATSFRVQRPKSASPQIISLAIAGKVFHSTRAAGRNDSPPQSRVLRSEPRTSGAQHVTVIVPVYGDYDATRVCIAALLDELRSSNHRAILVDDATPEPRIAKYLAKVATAPRVEVIVNARNLGFIGSINCALERTKDDDVILLNSDTIVPRGFINRLVAAAQSAPDIGTVTPLSNNGEFVSFPVPNKANPLGSRSDVERIDAIAAKANADITIDIPSGIAFCLYISRACLNRVGSLSDDFAPGYLDDADFCLRAREQGFRNVCSPAVYVGHAGSKSFGQEKRSLVVRNLRILERRFPKHRLECAVFMAADPLRTARAAIERTAVRARHPRLLITGSGVIAATARQRAREIASAAQPVMILEVRYQANGTVVEIKGVAGAMPQSLQFNLSSSSECEALLDFIKSNEPSRIEFLDPANTPFRLVDLLSSLKVPYDLFIADAGLLGRHNEQIFTTAVQSSGVYEIKMPGALLPTNAAKQANWTKRWRGISEGAQRIVVPSPQAKVFATSVLARSAIDRINCAYESRSPERHKRQKAATCHLGFVPVRSCAREQRLMSETARQLGRIRPDISVTVLGTALDDIDLMRRGNAFVTGAIEPDEFVRLVDALEIESLFVSATQPIFAHPILSVVRSCYLPTAYFDWSGGRLKSMTKDLPIDPGASVDEVVEALSRWMPKRLGNHQLSSQMA